MNTVHTITGYYVDEQDYRTAGTLVLTVDEDGIYRDAHTGDTVTVETVSLTQTTTDTQITGAGAWRFSPDAGEIERIGLVVAE